MKSKTKRQTNAHPMLSRFARFLYWVGWMGVIVSFIYAFQRFGYESRGAWASGSFYHNFHFMIWQPFTTALVSFVAGGFPSGFSILIGHLITRVFRLEDENRALEELTQTLMRERDDAVISQRLIEQDVSAQDLSEEDRYEQISMHR